MDHLHTKRAACPVQRALAELEPRLRAQIAKARLHSLGDVQRRPRRELRPLQMRDAGSDQSQMRTSARPAILYTSTPLHRDIADNPAMPWKETRSRSG